jgi:hypothetical protein
VLVIVSALVVAQASYIFPPDTASLTAVTLLESFSK